MPIIGQNEGRVGKINFGMSLPAEMQRLLASAP